MATVLQSGGRAGGSGGWDKGRERGAGRILGVVAGSVSAVLIGALVVMGALALLVVTAAALIWRRWRRRLRALRASAGVRTAVALLGVFRGGRSGFAGPARLRFELWQSVAAATRAVRAAHEAGASMADLPALCRRLNDAAGDLDRLLVMASGIDPASPPVAELRRQVGEALDASNAIRVAALASANDAASASVGELAADAGREVQAVAAGVARTRSAFSDR